MYQLACRKLKRMGENFRRKRGTSIRKATRCRSRTWCDHEEIFLSRSDRRDVSKHVGEAFSLVEELQAALRCLQTKVKLLGLDPDVVLAIHAVIVTKIGKRSPSKRNSGQYNRLGLGTVRKTVAICVCAKSAFVRAS